MPEGNYLHNTPKHLHFFNAVVIQGSILRLSDLFYHWLLCLVVKFKAKCLDEEIHVMCTPCEIVSFPPLGCMLIWAGPLVLLSLRSSDGSISPMVWPRTACCLGLVGHFFPPWHRFLWEAEQGCLCLPLGLELGTIRVSIQMWEPRRLPNSLGQM